MKYYIIEVLYNWGIIIMRYYIIEVLYNWGIIIMLFISNNSYPGLKN